MDYRNRYVNGNGKYIDDIKFDDMLYMSVYRSQYGRAKINNVTGGLNANEFNAYYKSSAGEMASLGAEENKNVYLEHVFATDYVNYQGQPIAAVFGKTRYESEDLLNTVKVDYEPLKAISSIDESLKGDIIHEGTKNNILASHELGNDFNENDIDYDIILEDEFFNERIIANPIETRGCIANYKDNKLYFHVSTQSVQSVKTGLIESLNLNDNDVIVIQADTGGAFGVKGSFYPEYVMAAYASMKYKKPVKWIETRSEHLMAAYPGRGVKAKIKIYAKNNGKITGLKGEIYVDAGAYDAGTGSFAPRFIAYQLTGPYNIENAYVKAISLITNKAPMGPYRGAGRPEAAFLMERMIDLLADKLKMDIADVRLINASDKPFKSPLGLEIKEATKPFLENALKDLNYKEISKKEKTGIAFFVLIPASRPGESARIIVNNGKVKVYLGGNVHGQGHEIFVKNILEKELKIRREIITLENGDTSMMKRGVGTWGSRSAIAGGSALLYAAREIKKEIIRKYGDYTPEKLLSGNFDKYKFIEIDYDVNSINFNMITSSMDKTGRIKVDKWYSYYDLGNVLSEMNVKAQIMGGAMEGIGQVFSESLKYSDGQLLTQSISDAGLLTSDHVPEYYIKWIENPSAALNGAKGLGEAPTIGTPVALARSIELNTGKRIRETPVKFEDLILKNPLNN